MELTQPLGDNDLMPFGEFEGYRMIEVPDWYLKRIARADWLEERYPEVHAYIEDNWDAMHSKY